MRTLCATTPFLCMDEEGAGKQVMLLDSFELDLGLAKPVSHLVQGNLVIGGRLPAQEAVALVEEQYQAALEFIFSHPIWRSFRNAEGASHLHAYYLETRHYLAAASYRMASGIPTTPNRPHLTSLLAEHVVEEADHNIYFENGLGAIGCNVEQAAAARPLPATTEWIYLMRTLSSFDPLCASLSSGLLESSARDRDSVKGWHTMISDLGLVPKEAAKAIFEHVSVDIELGHGANWEKALRREGDINPQQLAQGLNGITLVAEGIYRWLDMLSNGLGSSMVRAFSMPLELDSICDKTALNTSVVWPAEVLHLVSHGDDLNPSVNEAVALAYGLGPHLIKQNFDESASPLLKEAATLAVDLPVITDKVPESSEALIELVEKWMCSINGHRLWDEMLHRPSIGFTYGWLLENYHYIAAISHHTGTAIAACTDPKIRQVLVHHLEEELDHSLILRKSLENVLPDFDIGSARPLSSTTQFLGGLNQIASQNWRAYAVALAYLQLSLSVDDHEGLSSQWYNSLIAKMPEAETLVAAMREHDEEDTGLDHAQDVRELLSLLLDRDHLTPSVLAEASVIPQLAWSFLDGIRCHYKTGSAAIYQRVGWSAKTSGQRSQ